MERSARRIAEGRAFTLQDALVGARIEMAVEQAEQLEAAIDQLRAELEEGLNSEHAEVRGYTAGRIFGATMTLINISAAASAGGRILGQAVGALVRSARAGMARVRRMATGIPCCFVAGTLVVTPAGAVPIEDVELGARVEADDALCADIDPSGWWQVTLDLTTTDGGEPHAYRLNQLRSPEWFEDRQLQVGDPLYLEIEDLEIEGHARVLAIDRDGVPVSHGPGCAVTGLMSHVVSSRLRIEVKGLTDAIEVTASHLLYSDARDRWVQAGDLDAGERLRTLHGSAPVRSIQTVSEVSPVFNLEVAGAHAYFVSDVAVLVHNGCSDAPAAGGGARPPADGVRGRLDPLPQGQGPHSVYRRDQGTGRIEHYQTWEAQTNPRSPHPYQPGVRYDGQGPGHFNRATGERVSTPHVHDRAAPGGVRPPRPDEIPGGG